LKRGNKMDLDKMDMDFVLGEVDFIEENVKVLSKKSFHRDRELQDSIDNLWDALDEIYSAIPSLKYKVNQFPKLRLQIDKETNNE